MAFDALTANSTQFKTELKAVVKAMDSLQDRIHGLCVYSAVQWLKHDNVDTARALVESINPYGGSVRVQAIAYWFTEAVGLSVTIDDKKKSITIKKNKSFDWEQESQKILDFGKDNPFYKFAPREKALNTPKISLEGTAVTMARGLLTGDISPEDIKKAIGELHQLVEMKTRDSKVKSWVDTYKEQNEGKEQDHSNEPNMGLLKALDPTIPSEVSMH